jgi:hypothetical protein
VWGLWWAKWLLDRFFRRVLRRSPISIIPRMFHSHSVCVHVCAFVPLCVMYASLCVCAFVMCVCVRVCAFMCYVCMFVRLCLYVLCMHVCAFVLLCVMYACLCVCLCSILRARVIEPALVPIQSARNDHLPFLVYAGGYDSVYCGCQRKCI